MGLLARIVSTLTRARPAADSPAVFPRALQPVLDAMEFHGVSSPANLLNRNLILSSKVNPRTVAAADEWLRVDKLGAAGKEYLRVARNNDVLPQAMGRNHIHELFDEPVVLLVRRAEGEGGPFVVTGRLNANQRRSSPEFTVEVPGASRLELHQHNVLSIAYSERRARELEAGLKGWQP